MELSAWFLSSVNFGSHWMSEATWANSIRVWATSISSLWSRVGQRAFAISVNTRRLSLVKATILVISSSADLSDSSSLTTWAAPEMIWSLTSCGMSTMHFVATWPGCLQQKETPSFPFEFPQSTSAFDSDLHTPPCFHCFPAKYMLSPPISLLPLCPLGEQFIITIWALCSLTVMMISVSVGSSLCVMRAERTGENDSWRWRRIILMISVAWRGCFIAASWCEIDWIVLMDSVAGLDGSWVTL